jgi:hypothetical protein
MFAKIVTHVAAWLVFLSLPVIVLPRRGGPPDDRPPLPPPEEPETGRMWFFMVMNLFHIAFFYLNYSVLVPRLLLKGKRWQYFSAIAGVFVIMGVSSTLLYEILIATQPGMDFMRAPGVFGLFSICTLVWAASSGIRLNTEWNRAETLRRESENARLNAELSQLKSQINPHFLFNTLNGIYTLTLSKNDAAPDAVMKLSQLLRYVIADTDTDFVPLEKDLEHLHHFIDLHRMRLTPKTSVALRMEGDPAGKKIAPLLLLPFVENAFKFGSSAREDSPIDIDIRIEASTLHFECRNTVRNRQSDSPGIGLTNTRRRLDLLYPGRYSLESAETGGVYVVKLRIDL